MSKAGVCRIFWRRLAEHISGQQGTLVGELDSLRLNVEHINQIVAMQQSYASAGGVIEEIEVAGIVGDALALNTDALLRHGMEVVREDDGDLGRVPLDRHKTLQILVNLIRNAKHAMQEAGASGRQLTIRTRRNADATFAIIVSDQGDRHQRRATPATFSSTASRPKRTATALACTPARWPLGRWAASSGWKAPVSAVAPLSPCNSPCNRPNL